MLFPKINLKLAVYSDTKEAHLLNGAGVFNESLPKGKDSPYHLVLVGHTGITAKILFDNINKLSIDDEFYVQILNDKYKYKVCKINTVLPDQAQKLFTKNDEKLASLVTCTPKYINTHRLVVTGKEVKNPL